jgi:2-polyprenyl-3-methyl-5-hydroxy-6-metoxy-1,4-benzoquinol methylase
LIPISPGACTLIWFLSNALLSISRGVSTAQHNSLENMDEFYSNPHLLTHYFTPERLDFYRTVCRRLGRLDIQPTSVLDVGRGSGHLLAQIRELWPNARLKGVDFSGRSIERV